MYDSTNEAHEFVGEDRDDAIRKATAFFGVEIDALEISEFAAGTVYGVAGRAVVVAAPKGRRRPAPERGRGRRGEEPRSENRQRRPERERSRGRETGGRAPSTARPAERPSEPSVGTAKGELGPVGVFLLGLVERMDQGPFEIAERTDGDLLIYELAGGAAENLVGGDGRTIDAMQLLANQVAMRAEDEPRRIVVEVEGNAKSRDTLLEKFAHRGAERARQTGRPVKLDPMNGGDRRAIHLALRDEDGIATMSIGEGQYRQVVVVPEGAPDYERAVRESERAATDSER